MKKFSAAFLAAVLFLTCSFATLNMTVYANDAVTVKSGDVFWKIARDAGLTIDELKALNPQIKNINLIYPGDKINVSTGMSATAAPAPVSAPAPAPSTGGKASVVSTEVNGHNGPIAVETTVDNGKITAVKITKHNESPVISDLAISRIPEDIVKYQSVGVDVVSGATITSNAIIKAVTDALPKLGLDVAAFSAKPAASTKKAADIEKTADVIVIGGGGAGLAAAVSAHQNGAKVIVIEKMPKLGGNTVISGAAYNTADPERQLKMDPPIEDSPDKHFEQTFAGGDEKANPELVRTFVDNSLSTLHWLESIGMEWTDEVFTVLGGMWPRAHKPVKPLGTGYIDALSSYISKNSDGIELMLETKGESLIAKDGVVTGVIASGRSGNTITLKANNGVVIATGGFGANVEMRDKYNKSWPSLTNIKTTNHPGATGDGLAMAEAVGANLIDLDYIQLLPMGDPNTGSLSGNIEQDVEKRIFVNKDGNRFVAEDARRDVMTSALFEQRDTYMWVILDKHSYPTGDTKNNFNESIDQLVSEGRAFKADTLEDLAAQIKVDPANLVKAVEEFNKAVDAGTDSFGRKLFSQKIDTAPFYAGGRMPTVHHTMGGIQINTSTQVLNKNGDVIKGLYAAGEVTGGIHGTNRLGGNALADAHTFGKIAGEAAATGKSSTASTAPAAPAPAAAAPPQAPEVSKGIYTAGSYTASARGFGGDVEVTVQVDENKILSVTAKGDSETAGIGTPALDKLPDAIVAANSADVDTIAGATVTSNAIISAVKSALEDAK